MISIRRVDVKDYAGVLTHLHEKSFPYDEVPALDGLWWIAFDDELPVAFAAMKQSAQWCDTIYLSRCGVMRSHRGRGLQSRLIRVREQAARRGSWKWVVTDTNLNTKSSNNLIKAGYRLYEPAKPWSLQTALYWKKNLKRESKCRRPR